MNLKGILNFQFTDNIYLRFYFNFQPIFFHTTFNVYFPEWLGEDCYAIDYKVKILGYDLTIMYGDENNQKMLYPFDSSIGPSFENDQFCLKSLGISDLEWMMVPDESTKEYREKLIEGFKINKEKWNYL